MLVDPSKPPQIKNTSFLLEYDNGYKILSIHTNGEQRFYKLGPNEKVELGYHGKILVRRLNDDYTEGLTLIDHTNPFYSSEAEAHNSMPVTTQNSSVKTYLKK